MGKREFFFSVITSVVAAILMELTGVLNLSKYLKVDITIPFWGLFLFVVSPIVISIFWFRKSITPAHQLLITDNQRLSDEVEVKDSTLTEQKNLSASLEELLSSAKQENEKLKADLEVWDSFGIKIHDPDKPLEQITNRSFGAEIVEIDGKDFLNCNFIGSILKFKGTSPVGLNHIHMEDVRWVMDGPAGNAFQLLGALYKTEEPELVRLVEATFDNIRGRQKPQVAVDA